MTTESDRPDLLLVSPVRTPIGKFGGALAALSAVDLGLAAASACIERAGLPIETIDQVVFGHARQAGCGPNPARQIAHRCNVPDDRPAMTINQACGSGLQAVFSAARAILLGEAEVVLAGGTESMSNTPYLLSGARWGQRLGHDEIVDGMERDGSLDPLSELMMGETAEELAAEAGIDRPAADRWAARSQKRCEKAREEGFFQSEIVPVEVVGRRATSLIEGDEHPRDGVTAESLANLPPAFRDEGTVTAGNASGITDGAAAVAVASASAVERLGLQPMARLVDWEVVGVDPRVMGIGPVPAVRNLLARRALSFDDIELVELNEASASEALACLAELPFDRDKVNVTGGAISLGHPIGCSGTRILVTLLHGMNRLGSRRGIATLGASGGMGLAALVERHSS